MKKFLQRMFKKPPFPAVEHSPMAVTPPYRSFNTPAQMQAYCDARFDRLRWLDGEADEQHIAEPGAGGVLDASSGTAEMGENFELTTPDRRFNRRNYSTRLRSGT